jgi:hypothetical protein
MTRRLLLPLVLLLLVTGAGQAYAAVEIEASATPFEPAAEVSEEDEAEEECVEGEGEGEGESPEVSEESCEEAGDSGAKPGDGCPLRSAHAHAATQHNTLKITIGYTTDKPVAAKIQLKAGGNPPKTFKRHLTRSGVLRFTERMGDSHGKLTVLIEPVGPAGCPSRRLVLFRH